MSRRTRRRAGQINKLMVLKFKTGVEQTVHYMGESHSGKSIKIRNEKGLATYILKNRIESLT